MVFNPPCLAHGNSSVLPLSQRCRVWASSFNSPKLWQDYGVLEFRTTGLGRCAHEAPEVVFLPVKGDTFKKMISIKKYHGSH